MNRLDKAEQALQEASRRYSFDETPQAAHALRSAATSYAQELKSSAKGWQRTAREFYTFESDVTTMRGAS